MITKFWNLYTTSNQSINLDCLVKYWYLIVNKLLQNHRFTEKNDS